MAVVVLELLHTGPEGAVRHVRSLVHMDRRGQSLLHEGHLVEQSHRPTIPATERAV
jgi:hypothetical protein